MSRIGLENAVASAVLKASACEKALHDAGPWTLCYGPFEVPAVKTIDVDQNSIVFEATMPAQCYLVKPAAVLAINLRGYPLDARPISCPGDGPWIARWRYRIGESVPAL